jgi:hypothetical protein
MFLTRLLQGGVAGACCVLAASAAAAQSAGDDQLPLYRLALSEPELTGRRSPSETLVVQRQVIDPGSLWDFPSDEVRPDHLDPLKRLAYAQAETIERFMSPGDVRQVPAGVAGEPAVAVLDWSDLNNLWADRAEGGTAFASRFGQTARIIQFSAAGVNAAGTEALLYISELCGPGCGAGHFVLFRRAEGKWRIERIDRFVEY